MNSYSAKYKEINARIVKLERVILERVAELGPIRKLDLMNSIAPVSDSKRPTDRQLLDEHILQMVIDGKLDMAMDWKLQRIPKSSPATDRKRRREGPTLG